MNREYRDIIFQLSHGFISQHDFLDWLYNKCGPFMVQSHTRGEEEKMTRWYDWMVARERRWLRKNVNHRSIVPCELVFDLDLPKWLSDNERQSFLDVTLRRLKEEHGINPVIIDTGKGYHLHYFDLDMFAQMLTEHNPREYKRQYAQKIMADVRSDMMKWNDRSMIAIECCRHWKRGNKTVMIKL